ncbi:MAG: protein translocase subunit SecF [Angelakisella sp.]
MVDFYGKKKLFFGISLGLIALCLVFSLIFGVELDIQFRGGSIMTYTHSGEVDTASIEKELQKLTGDNVSVQHGESAATGLTTFTVALAQSQGITPEEQMSISGKLAEMYPTQNIETASVTNVDATIGKEFFVKSIIAVIVAALVMILYIAFRFRNIGGWSAGVMAVIALFHDILLVFAAFVFLRIPLNDNFIAVVLTILGYSLNDTIIIYDRIRENEKLMSKKAGLSEIVNLSINQSLSRAFGTTFATVLSMVVVAVVAGLYGISSIITFAIPMIAGMISGFYSSVCITGPLWVLWETKFPSERNKQR